ncbi:MAG TPA: hypothetical protein VKT52_06540 [Ktedonobacterales bacterium]|nr:hypothetical protein [Ktedonobacterales bacterium]
MPQRTAPIAFRYGAIFGVIITVIGGGNTLVQNIRQGIGPSANGLVLVSCVWFIATIGLLFVSGIMAARQNGRLAAGTWAGAIAAAIPALVFGIFISLQVLSEQLSKNQPQGSAEIIGYGIGVMIVVAMLLLIAGAIGAGLGVLGALIGRSQYRIANPQAYPAYQAYPWYPPYGAPYSPHAANPTMPPYPGMPPLPYPPQSSYPPYAGYPLTGQYPPSDMLASQYGQAPVYPPPPPDYPRPARPNYLPDEGIS